MIVSFYLNIAWTAKAVSVVAFFLACRQGHSHGIRDQEMLIVLLVEVERFILVLKREIPDHDDTCAVVFDWIGEQFDKRYSLF
jgi:hypothetical protein